MTLPFRCWDIINGLFIDSPPDPDNTDQAGAEKPDCAGDRNRVHPFTCDLEIPCIVNCEVRGVQPILVNIYEWIYNRLNFRCTDSPTFGFLGLIV